MLEDGVPGFSVSRVTSPEVRLMRCMSNTSGLRLFSPTSTCSIMLQLTSEDSATDREADEKNIDGPDGQPYIAFKVLHHACVSPDTEREEGGVSHNAFSSV